MIKNKKFHPNELFDTFNFLSQIIISDFSKNSIYKLVYNQMQLFSKEELENIKDNEGKKVNLYELCKYIKSPELMSVLIEKKVFWNTLTPYTKWIIENVENPSDELYASIFHIEKGLNKELNEDQKNSFFIEFIHKFCFDLISNEKKELMEKFYNAFFENYKKEIICNLIHMAPVQEVKKKSTFKQSVYNHNNNIDNNSNYTIYSFYLEKFSKNKISLQEYNINMLLPYDDSESKFLISHINLNKMKFLFNHGFSINDYHYEFNDDVLLANLLDKYRKQEDVLEMFMPHIKNFNMKKMTLKESDSIIKSCNQKIQTIYLNNKLNYELNTSDINKPQIVKKLKI